MYSWLFFSPLFHKNFHSIIRHRARKVSQTERLLFICDFRMHAIRRRETIINSCEGNIMLFFFLSFFFVTTFIGAELDFYMYTHQWRRREHGVQLLCELFTSCVLLPASAVMIIGWWGRGDDEGRMRVLCCLQSRVTLAWWGTPTSSRSEKRRESSLFSPIYRSYNTKCVKS